MHWHKGYSKIATRWFLEKRSTVLDLAQSEENPEGKNKGPSFITLGSHNFLYLISFLWQAEVLGKWPGSLEDRYMQ